MQIGYARVGTGTGHSGHRATAGELRLHGRDPKAYITGKTVAVRFNYDYSDAELGEIAGPGARLSG